MISSASESRPTGAIYPAFAMDMRVVGKDDVKPLPELSLVADDPNGDAEAVTPTSPVTVGALFSAIANDSFFELMASQHLSLSSPSSSESDLSSIGSPVAGAVVPASSSTCVYSHDMVEFQVDVNRYVDGFGKTLLHHACRFGNVQVAQCLLFHGASASAQCPHGRTPFHDAVSSRSDHTLELLRILFAHEPAGMSIVDVNGGHVLHLAAIHGRLDVIQWCASLFAHTGHANTSSQHTTHKYLLQLSITSFGGRNMLHYAAYNGRLEVLQWLLEGEDNERVNDFDVSAMDANGYSLLHFAAMGGHLDVCEWLVLAAPGRRSLSINARNCEGKRAVDLAKEDAIKTFLTEAGRNPRPPCAVRCIGADHCSLGITWTIEHEGDDRLRETLAPETLSLEFCRKPVGLSHAAGAGVLAMLLSTPRSQNLLRWENVEAMLPASANEYWLPGLEEGAEYLVRMQAINRNGASEYSFPSLAGGFSTLSNETTSTFIDTRLSTALHQVAFVGNLRFELLEGRRMPSPRRARGCHSIQRRDSLSSTDYHAFSTRDQVDAGQYYCIISVELPGVSNRKKRTPRRRTVPMTLGSSHNATLPLSPLASTDATIPAWRKLYCVRSGIAGVQEMMVRAGSSCAANHPEFAFNTTFRVPDPSLALIRVEVRCQTKFTDDCVGVCTLRMLDLVRGLPMKTQWFALDTPPRKGTTLGSGFVLVRTLFLTDGAVVDASDASSYLQGSVTPRSKSSTGLDRFGFRIFDPQRQTSDRVAASPNAINRPIEYYEQLHELLDRQQARRWEKFAAAASTAECASGSESDGDDSISCAAVFALAAECSSTKQILRDFAWQGFPGSHRAAIYKQLASRIRRSFPSDYFSTLVHKASTRSDRVPSPRGVKSPTASTQFQTARRQIAVDLQRTFAGNESWINTSEGQEALGRVLEAFVVHNPAVGYCQSMTFIVGRLLCLFHHHEEQQAGKPSRRHRIHPLPVDSHGSRLHKREEEDAFWLSVVIFDELFPTYFADGMKGLQVDARVLEQLIKSRLPQLDRHLQKLQAPHVGLFLATQWLLPVFCAGFPTHTTFQMLDVLLLEGSAAVFALAVALLRVAQPELLAERSDYLHVFRALKQRDQRLHDASLLLEVARDEFQLLPAAAIASMRANAMQ